MKVRNGPNPVTEPMAAYRAIHRLTQSEAAVRLGVKQETWCRWERGTRWPDPAWRERILALCTDHEADTPTPFAQACKAFRQREGVSQKEAAELLGVDIRTWERWEGGHMAPKRHSREFWRLLNRPAIELRAKLEERRAA